MSFDQVSSAMSALSTLPAIPRASERVAQAVRALRFSSGLRRAWKEARTEASVRYIQVALPQVSLSQIRREIVGNSEPVGWQEQAIWRVHADAVSAMTDLNRTDSTQVPVTPTQLLSRLWRDAQSTHPDPNVRDRAGLLTPEGVQTNELVLGLIDSDAPGILVTAVMIGHLLDRPSPDSGQEWVRDALVRWYLNHRGIEPTGTLVIHPHRFLEQLDLYRSGTRESMNDWINHVAQVLVEATSDGLELANSIMAGRTDPNYR